jgi:zinc resistance-associated protein
MRTHPNKGLLLIILLLVLTLGAASIASAQPRGMGDGMGLDDWGLGPGPKQGRGRGMMQMTPEQAGKVFDLHHKFMNDTADLRRQMFIKRAELAELWRAAEPDKAKIAAKQKELNALRDQLQEKSIPYRAEMRQLCPGFAQGPGFGPSGPGGAPKR